MFQEMMISSGGGSSACDLLGSSTTMETAISFDMSPYACVLIDIMALDNNGNCRSAQIMTPVAYWRTTSFQSPAMVFGSKDIPNSIVGYAVLDYQNGLTYWYSQNNITNVTSVTCRVYGIK